MNREYVLGVLDYIPQVGPAAYEFGVVLRIEGVMNVEWEVGGILSLRDYER